MLTQIRRDGLSVEVDLGLSLVEVVSLESRSRPHGPRVPSRTGTSPEPGRVERRTGSDRWVRNFLVRCFGRCFGRRFFRLGPLPEPRCVETASLLRKNVGHVAFLPN